MKNWLWLLAMTLAGCAFVSAPMDESTPTQKPTQLETTRAFLVGKEEAQPHYGLYSYLLLGGPPSSADARKRYASVISAFLSQILPTTAQEEYVARWQLNITYLPITEPVPAGLASGETSPAADWLLAHYNYPRARAVLRQIPGSHRDGPYFISCEKPLDGNGAPGAGPYLFQDLSHVHPDMAEVWVRQFMDRASKPDYYNEDALKQMALDLRNQISVAGNALPKVQAALTEWIKVL